MSYIVSPAIADGIVLSETDTVKSVLQNIGIILATKQGTVPLYREFGLSGDLLDKPIDVAQSLMAVEVKEAIEQWEPRAEVISVSFEVDKSAPGLLRPIVEVEINE